MKHLFYFIAVIFAIYQIVWIIKPSFFVKRHFRFKRLLELNNDLDWSKKSKEYKRAIMTRTPYLIFWAWFIAGLFSFNSFAFWVYILFNFFVIGAITRVIHGSSLYPLLRWLNSVISLSWAVFIIMNAYYLRMNYEDVINFLF